MNKKMDITNCKIGDRILFYIFPYTDDVVFEGIIKEFSPSKKYVKILDYGWAKTDSVIVLELLN